MADIPSTPPLIVGVGASNSALSALEEFLQAVPARSGWSGVISASLSAEQIERLKRALSSRPALSLREAGQEDALSPDTWYVPEPGKHLALSGGRLVSRESTSDMPADALLKSLAAEAGTRAAAVILSGNGSDGAAGIMAVAAAGGFVLAQDPATTDFNGAARAAIATGAVHAVLSPSAMPEALRARLAAAGAAANDTESSDSDASLHADLAPVLQLLRGQHGLDFTLYRTGTVDRRIRRRMALLECPDLPAYLARLRQDRAELESLRQDLLIGVTEFFREPDTFAWLGENIFQPALREAGRREYRIWCAGCATGEEAYSLAMLLDEAARDCGFSGRLSVFATDINSQALDHASRGHYERRRLGGLSPERLSRYFVPQTEDGMRVCPELRARVVFAPHDVLVDPPFTRIDLVVCRNLLIYLEPKAQERVIARFHHALRSGGVLFLGASESLGRHAADFDVLEPRHKLYRKNHDRRLPLEPRLSSGYGTSTVSGSTGHVAGAAPVARHLLSAYDHLLSRHAPPGFLVDSTGLLLHCFGDAGRLLSPPEGRLENHLLARTKGDLRLACSTLLTSVLRGSEPAEAKGVRVARDGEPPELIDIVAERIPEPGPGPALVHFALHRVSPAATAQKVEKNDVPEAPGFAPDQAKNDRLADLEAELQTTKDKLHATVEQLQVVNEAMQSTNEEMLASNEELQASNEELQSLNEELRSVNAEFERKNGELHQLNADLDNLLGALEVGTVFLDRELRIRKFNASIQSCFRLLPQDIGRPLAHIAYQLENQAHLLAEVARVLSTGDSARREIRSRDGRWFLKRILPFLNLAGNIEGVVLTFTDITTLRHMRERFDLAIEASHLVWWDWNIAEDRLATHSAGACILGENVVCRVESGKGWMDLVHPDDRDRVRAQLDAVLRGETPAWDCEHRFQTASGAWLWVANKGRVTERNALGHPLRMLGTTQDIDARKAAEVAVARDLELLAHVPDAVICVDADGIVTYWNHAATELYGWQPGEILGRPLLERFPAEVRASIAATLADSINGRDFSGEFEDYRRDGSRVWVDARSHRLLDQDGRLFGVMGISRDITEARRQREERARIEHQLAQSQKMETLGNLAGGIAHDFNNLLAAILGYAEIATGLLSDGHPALAKLASVRQAGQRAAELVRRILAFSRAGEQPRRPVRVAQVVEETLPLLRASLPSTIRIKSRVAPDADQSVLGDSTQLQQVLLNLCTNSAYAIGVHGGGELRIDLEPIELATPPPLHAGTIAAGPALLLSVGDNGCGMPPAIIERIFEPFFTTKPVGEGTGLGLSIVHSIIAAHGGGIFIETTPGSGTTFRIYLPTLSSIDEALPDEEAALAASSIFPCGNGERVAVIDDEESVALLTQQALERYGYAAEIMPDAPTCLKILRERPDAFALVVTDQTMPLMTGLELVEALRASSLQTPVLLLSGYSRALDPAVLPTLGRVGFLAKPFVLADLLEHVNAIVRPPSGPGA